MARTTMTADHAGARVALWEFEKYSDEERYLPLDEIARGGGGRIAIAFDRKLGRHVALKRPLAGSDAARLEREALVMARLEHPAIVPVHDAGRDVDGEPFYAMKLLGGPNLATRIAEAGTFEQRLGLLRVVSAVADAIAYAHSQRVIHRDLKPSNVVVGEFGEVAVIDWGLAKLLGGPDDPVAAEASSSISAELTEQGSIVGTPAYMAPEQAAGHAVDERTDVYALGAMLYEVLGGVPPHGRGSVTEALRRVRTEAPTAIEFREPRVPDDLAAIVAKAMARDPADRYATARELADDLHSFEAGRLVAAHRYTRWMHARRWLRNHQRAVAAAVAIAATGGLAAVLFIQPTSASAVELCDELDAPVAAVWNPSQRAAIENVFAATGAPSAVVERNVQIIAGQLDDRAARIAEMRRAACTARATGEQSSEAVDDRMVCLDQRLAELRAVVGALGRVTRLEIDHAADAVDAIHAIGDCADVTHLREAPLPANPAVRGEVLAIDARLAALDADVLVGRVAEARAQLPGLTERAKTLGHAPVLARALELMGEVAFIAGSIDDSARVLGDALVASEHAHDDRVRGLALVKLAAIALNEHDRYGEAEAFAAQARAIGERTADTALLRSALGSLAQIAAARDDHKRAVELARQMRELADRPGVAPVRRAEAIALYGQQLAEAQRLDEARPLVEEGLRAMRAATASADQPAIATMLATRAHIALLEGSYADAERDLREAVAMDDRTSGIGANRTQEIRNLLATSLKMQDKYADAEAVLVALRDGMLRQRGRSPRTLANVYWQLGDVQRLVGRHAEALAAFTESARIAAAFDPESGDYAQARASMGSTRLALGRNADALADLAAATPLLEKIDGADGETTVFARADYGKALRATGHPREAVAALERSLPAIDKLGGPDAGEAHYELARAQLAAGDRSGARTHAATARARLVAAGPQGAPLLREVTAWTSARGLR